MRAIWVNPAKARVGIKSRRGLRGDPARDVAESGAGRSRRPQCVRTEEGAIGAMGSRETRANAFGGRGP